MHKPGAFSYAVVRIVPHVEREEFVNAGVILFCATHDYLAAKVELDQARLLALAPGADVDTARRHLDAIPRVCRGGDDAGPIGRMPLRERWQWLVSPRSTILQTSAPHGGLTSAPESELERLFSTIVRTRS